MKFQQATFSNTDGRIAVFSDIHGNRQALDAILNDIHAKGIKNIVCNGDLIGSSSNSQYVVNRIRELKIPSTRGNHERYLEEISNPNDARWKLDNWEIMRHEFYNLDRETKEWLFKLPLNLCLYKDAPPLLMAHAAPDNDQAVVSASFKDKDWHNLFSVLPSNSTLVGSHVHIFWQHRWQDHYFVRTPSAGLPLDGDTRAGYCILERQDNTWMAQEYRIAYNLEKELTDLRNSKVYEAGGIFTHLVWLELKTARVWTGPFFKHLAKVFPYSEGQEVRKGYSHAEMNQAWKTFNRDDYPEHNPDLL